MATRIPIQNFSNATIDKIFSYATSNAVTGGFFGPAIFFLVTLIVFIVLYDYSKVRALAASAFVGLILSTLLYYWGYLNPAYIYISISCLAMSGYFIFKERNP